MKIKDILGEDGNLTVASVAGDKAKLSNGTEIDAKTLTPDPDKPGQLKAPEMDPNAIKPGAVVTTGDSTSENYGEEEESIVEKHFQKKTKINNNNNKYLKNGRFKRFCRKIS